ncbi:hypothetical protein HZH68_012792 [Vespula germanica]|uniref:Uncharacterized protein n=1 Tax=Vespula germanica TaxID=30212 RepID=A0A834JFL2_VESGE|nr:hypothetical protein HZH68_012792 [Vespula germanica]
MSYEKLLYVACVEEAQAKYKGVLFFIKVGRENLGSPVTGRKSVAAGVACRRGGEEEEEREEEEEEDEEKKEEVERQRREEESGR